MSGWDLQSLFNRHRVDLLRLLRSRVASPDTREDLVQEAFLHLLGVVHADPIANPKAYLFRAVDNLAIDFLRRERVRRSRFAEVEDSERIAADMPGPEATVDDKNRVKILSRAITELPPKCRQVFVLHKFDGLSHSAIATRLGISRSMVEKHIIKAMSHCRSRLDLVAER